MNVTMVSLWKSDEHRELERRVTELLSKTYPHLRWLWVVGDSTDQTEAQLYALSQHVADRVTIVHHDTDLPGFEPEHRLARGTATLNAALDVVEEELSDTDYIFWCESDLISATNVIQQLLRHQKDAVAGWPMLPKPEGAWVFYDTWGYRAGGDRKFTNLPPYHDVYEPYDPFEVESVGSAVLFRADIFRGPNRIRACESMGLVDICWRLRERGYSVWVDPNELIIQPTSLWTPQRHWR